jgi:hypothetical protein
MGLMFPKGQRHGRIDKSALPIGTPPRVEDEAYTKSAPSRDCERCGCPGSTGRVVACHVRAGHEGGGSYKPSDDLVVFMCNVCHAEQEADPGAEWWFENVFKTWLRRRYLRWKAAQA